VFSVFADISKHSDAIKIKAITAVRQITVTMLFTESYISSLTEERFRPLFVILAENGTMQTYLKQVM
jgi:hypothetical protein